MQSLKQQLKESVSWMTAVLPFASVVQSSAANTTAEIYGTLAKILDVSPWQASCVWGSRLRLRICNSHATPGRLDRGFSRKQHHCFASQEADSAIIHPSPENQLFCALRFLVHLMVRQMYFQAQLPFFSKHNLSGQPVVTPSLQSALHITPQPSCQRSGASAIFPPHPHPAVCCGHAPCVRAACYDSLHSPFKRNPNSLLPRRTRTSVVQTTAASTATTKHFPIFQKYN